MLSGDSSCSVLKLRSFLKGQLALTGHGQMFKSRVFLRNAGILLRKENNLLRRLQVRRVAKFNFKSERLPLRFLHSH